MQDVNIRKIKRGVKKIVFNVKVGDVKAPFPTFSFLEAKCYELLVKYKPPSCVTR